MIESIYTTSQWLALKSHSVLGKDKGFCVRTYSHMVHPPEAPTRTWIWSMQSLQQPTRNMLYHVSKYKCSQWELGLVVEEITSSVLRLSCRCTSADKSLEPLACRIVWKTLSRLQSALETLQTSNYNALVTESEWIKDKERLCCVQCQVEFTPFRRRHHCRRCGEIVCSSCSSFHVVALARGPLKIRMCVKCLEQKNYTQSDLGERDIAGSFQSGTTARSSVSPMEPHGHTFSLLRIADSIGIPRSPVMLEDV
jgi:hypothetical protein